MGSLRVTFSLIFEPVSPNFGALKGILTFLINRDISAEGTDNTRYARSVTMKVSHKLWIVVAVTSVTWLFCAYVTGTAMGQVILNVPLRMRICNSIYKALYFPWSWLPTNFFTWGRIGMESINPRATTIGLLWAIPVGLCISCVLFLRKRSITNG